MAAPVVIQGLPAISELRGAALSACSDALKHRACTAGDELDHAAPAATATIAWPDGTDRHVRISLERLDVSPPRRFDRETRFADEDPVVERWRTVGLVVAALMGESEVGSESSAAADDRASLALVRPDRASGFVTMAALVGPGLDDGSVRLGAEARGAFAFRLSPVFLAAAVSHAVRPLDDRGVSVQWTTLGVGAGARTVLPRADLGLCVRIELLVEWLKANDGAAALSGGGSRVSPGLRGGFDVVWPESGPLAITAGFSVWWLSGGTAIHIDQQKIGSSRWLSYAGLLGGQWRFR